MIPLRGIGFYDILKFMGFTTLALKGQNISGQGNALSNMIPAKIPKPWKGEILIGWGIAPSDRQCHY
jgi:hypothetical protein